MRKLAFALLGLSLGACNCDDQGLAVLTPRIEATPNPLAFGTAYVGLTRSVPLRIKNVGSAALSISRIAVEEGSFAGLSVPNERFDLAPAAAREVLVRLDATEIGPIQGAILISSNDPATPVLRVPIEALGAKRTGPALAVCVESADLGLAVTCDLPLRIDFGDAAVGSSLGARITLRSIGDQPVSITSAEAQTGSDPSFAFNPSATTTTLSPEAELPIEVTLTPAVEGMINAVFQVLSNDPERNLVPVILTAGGVRSGLCADPAVVDFNTTAIGQAVTRQVTLTNCGQAPLELTAVQIDNGAEFTTLALPAPIPLTPGASHVVDVTYTPTDAGADMGRLRAIASIGEAYVTLRGQTAACALVATPTAVSFGAVSLNQTRDRPVLVENQGAADCHISNLQIVGAEFGLTAATPASQTIAPGASATLGVTYTPVDDGMDTGTLTILSDDTDMPSLVVTLDGRRRAIGECELTAMPDPVAFGVAALGSRQTRPVTITNTGSSLCTILQVGTTGSSAFSATGMPTLPLLTSGNSFTVDVYFQPLTTGPDTANLEIRTGITTPPTTVPLTGFGSGPRLCVMPDPVIFGTHPLGSTVTRSTSLVACGDQNVVISALNLAAPTSSEYQIVALPSLPLTLPSGTSMPLDLRYVGTDAGRDDGILRIMSNDVIEPSQDVALIAATGATCGDLVGRICGLDGSGPAPGATVYVDTPSGRVQTTTDENGDFVLTCLPVGGVTITAESGSWSTSFGATVVDQTVTTIPGQQCLNPQSARVAVAWGQYDQIENILTTVGVPYTFYDQSQQEDLLTDPTEMAMYDIIFLNCGFNEHYIDATAYQHLRDFVANGGSVYASDWSYDVVEVGWPMFVDFYQDDAIRGDAEDAGNFNGLVDVVEPSLRSALNGRGAVSISSCCTGIDSAAAATTVYLEGDRLGDGGTHPFFVSFSPSAGAGTVMYTDFHNTGQADIDTVFRWLINRL